MKNNILRNAWKNAVVFSRHGRFFYYDCCIGAILELSEGIFKKIECYGIDSKECDELRPLRDLREELGVLDLDECPVSETEYIAYLSFAPTHECNLNCSYCYGGQGKNYVGEIRGFDEETIRYVIDTLVNDLYEDAAAYRIDFVGGGEPLLHFAAVQYTVDYIERLAEKRGKRITAWVCTNGTLITDEIAEYLVAHKVPLGISLDGVREKHNASRPFKNGNGSYDAVMEGIERYRKHENNPANSNLWALCTATNDNCDFVAIIRSFLSLEFNNAQIRLIRSTGHYNIDNISREYDRLYDYLLNEFKCGNLKPLLMITNDNDQFGKILKRVMLNQHIPVRCLAGWRRITICPDGSIYPCDSFVGKADYCMGHIGESRDTIFDQIIYRKNFLIDNCAECDIRLICGGDCFYNSVEKTGSPYTPDSEYCAIQEHLVKNAVALCCDMVNINDKLYEEFARKVEIKDAYTTVRG